RSFDFARSSCVYEGIAKQLVHGLKFGNKKYYGRYMANVMAETYLNNDFDCDIILAVPLSKSRLVRRGYNQSFVLAQHLSKLLKLPLDTKSLVKIKDTPEQARKSGKQRELNVLGAYAVVNKTAICGRKVLIVDDVLTTGATTSEVAKMLYKAKARQAQVLTFASTQFKINADKLTAEIAQQSYAEID
ncbi:MAG: ComF family protein, partial [Clostridia bacterium]